MAETLEDRLSARLTAPAAAQVDLVVGTSADSDRAAAIVSLINEAYGYGRESKGGVLRRLAAGDAGSGANRVLHLALAQCDGGTEVGWCRSWLRCEVLGWSRGVCRLAGGRLLLLDTLHWLDPVGVRPLGADGGEARQNRNPNPNRWAGGLLFIPRPALSRCGPTCRGGELPRRSRLRRRLGWPRLLVHGWRAPRP